MTQFIFFATFAIALIVGIFAYFAPTQKPMSPVKFMMDNTGYTTEEERNHKRTQQLNMLTNAGLMQIRKQMDNLAIQQTKILDSIQDQQLVLQNTGKEASNILLLSSEQGTMNGNRDMLKLKALAIQMQDEQRLLVAHGQDLIAINNQLTKNRQWIVDQINLSNINSESALRTLQDRYTMLQDQAVGFLDKVNQHNQELRDRMVKIQDQLSDLSNNASYDSVAQQQAVKEHIQQMLDKQHGEMLTLAESEERSKAMMRDAQESFENSKELFNDSQQRSKDLIEDERQKAEDQKWINEQRASDQLQRMQDQQNR